MLKRLNKIANRSFQLNSVAIIKKATIGKLLSGTATNASNKLVLGLGAAGAISTTRKVEREKFNPARRDLMLGTAQPG